MKYFFLIFLFLFVSTASFGQENFKIDSLNKVLAKNIADTVRMKTLIALASEHLLTSPALAIKDCETSLAIATKTKSDEGTGEAYGWLAYLCEQQGDINKALDYYNKSLQLAIKIKSKRSEAIILNNIAAIYKDRGQIDDALKYHFKSLALSTEIKSDEGIEDSYNNIALIYQSQGKIPNAIDYFSKALKLAEKLNDRDGVATAIVNIGFIYKDQQQYKEAAALFLKSLEYRKKMKDQYGIGYSLNALGGLFEEQNKLDTALQYYQQALQMRTAIDDKQGVAYSLKNIGNVYRKLGKNAEAKEAYKKSLDGFEALADKGGIAIATNLYGSSLLSDKDYTNGEQYLQRSLQVARELGYPADIRNAAGNLQQLYRQKNNWKEALLMNDLYIQMRDSVQNDKNKKVAIQTQFKYDYEKKEAVLKSEQEKKDALAKKELQRQKIIRNGFIGGFALMVLFAGIFFKQRNKIKKEKQRSDELLLNILPHEVAEELKSKGEAEAKLIDHATVLFTDFKGFTQLSEKLTPKELVAEIHECFSAFDKIMKKHNVEKIKTIGDAYMAAGGLPVPNTTHATDIIHVALEIQKYMHEHKAIRESNGSLFFEIRIGVHTGPVVAGIVGVKKFAYDIWGDTVNIASRMESSGEVGKVNISESTYELVKDKFNCTSRGKISAKGKGEIEMYFVENFN